VSQRCPNGMRSTLDRMLLRWHGIPVSDAPPLISSPPLIADGTPDALAAAALDAEQEPESVVGPSTQPTFAVAAKRWLGYVEHDRKRKRSTVNGYRQTVRHDLLPVFGEQRLDEITGREVDWFRETLLSRRLSARSVNRILTQLQSMFTWFSDDNVYGLTVNPAARVRRQPQTRSGDFAVLSVAEVGALARVAVSLQDAALFTVAAFTGLRLRELRALRWRDVDFSGRIVHVR